MYPASLQQTELWPETFLSRGRTSRNLLWAIDIEGQVDRPRLANALNMAISRHASLRSRFNYRDGQLWVDETPLHSVELPVVDMSSLPKSVVQQKFEAFGHRPFDPVAGPLLRFLLVRLSSDRSVLLCGFHHLVMDGPSWPLFFQDLAKALESTPLYAPTLSYADYCANQNKTAANDCDPSYWHTIASGDSLRIALPWDAPASPHEDASSANLRFVFTPQQSKAITTRAKHLGTSPFRLCFAAFSAWLARLTGHQDQRLITAFPGRTLPDEKDLVGFCNTFGLVAARVQEDSPFRRHLETLSESLSEASRHQRIPAGLAMKAAGCKTFAREFNRQGAMFVKLPRQQRFATGGITMSDERIVLQTIPRELAVDWQEELDGIALTWTYPSGRLVPASVEAFAQQYAHMLEQFLDHPDILIGDVSLLPPEEFGQVLSHSCGPDLPFPTETSIAHQIFEQARMSPDLVAVVDGHLRLTYATVEGAASRLAQALKARGAKRGKLVPLVMASSAAFLIAEIAVMKTGAAFVPIDPNWPEARRQTILERIAPPVAVTGNAMAQSHTSQFCPAVEVNATGQIVNDPSPPLADPSDFAPVSGDDTVYCIFTSGSTGEPKGALNAHRGVANRLYDMTELCGSDGPPVVLAGAASTTDTHVWQNLWPLTVGGRTVILSREKALSAAALLSLCESEQATLMDFVPSVFRSFTDYLFGHPERAPALNSLKYVLIGGDKMDVDAIRAFKKCFSGVRMINTYGVTEASMASVFQEFQADSVDGVTIGRPIANTTAAVLDSRMRLQPFGAMGELYIGGIAVGQGYLGLPEETAKRFVLSPYPQLGGRLYRTGDRGRLRRDGSFEFYGRMDNQISFAGNRIEPGEVESSLLQHPAVGDAAVVLSISENKQPSLVAYIVFQKEDTVSAKELRKFLLARLPRHMVPSEYRRLDALPLTPVGKVDRKALSKARHGHALERRPAVEEKVDNATLAIMEVWREILGRADIGPHDDFFLDLGGDSLMALQCELACEERTGRAPDLHLFFSHSTPAELAKAISSNDTTKPQEISESFETILGRQRAFTSNWEGFRKSPESFLFTQNESGSGRHLFWCFQGFHELKVLAQALGPDRPVTGMRSGHMIMEYTDQNIEALASRYAEEIASVPASDGLVLGGNCQGAVIMQEVATILIRQGKDVEMLVHVDDTSFKPYPGPTTLIYGRESHLNPFNEGTGLDGFLRETYSGGVRTAFIPGRHGTYFQEPGISELAGILKRILAEPLKI